MSNLKMILFDGSEIELESFSLPMHAVMRCADEDEMLAKWKQLAPMNLSRVEVQQDGVPVYVFAGGKLEGQQSVMNGDGSLTVHFYFVGVQQEVQNDETLAYVTAAKIMMGEEV